MILDNIGNLSFFNPETGTVETQENTKLFINNGLISSASDGAVIDCGGALVTPGFVDPHTHPVFLDGREEEFGQRLAGVTYAEVAAQGGGIVASVNGVRNASKDELVERVSKRMDRFLKLGTTTVECKSGYGLDTESELKSLQVIHEVNEGHDIDMVPTFLGAHAFPPEFADAHEGYVDLLCGEMIPAVAEQGIAVFCDVFCENGYFSVDQSRRILDSAKKHGLLLRLHADEFEDFGAAKLATEVGAVSADHLMAVSNRGLEQMAGHNVMATLLPGTTFSLGKNTYAPARRILDMGIDLALATDFNPGSCHIQSMPFIILLACLYIGMTVPEAFAAATYFSAKALHMEHKVGSIANGLQADLIIWNANKIVEIPYRATDLEYKMIIKNGKVIDPLGMDT